MDRKNIFDSILLIQKKKKKKICTMKQQMKKTLKLSHKTHNKHICLTTKDMQTPNKNK
jgi:hypothetical protein